MYCFMRSLKSLKQIIAKTKTHNFGCEFNLRNLFGMNRLSCLDKK